MFRHTAAVLTVASVVALTACSNAEAPPPAEAGASALLSKAALPSECVDHPLLAAMPTAQTIAGKPLTEVECQAFSVSMTYGEPGTSAEILLIDSKAPVPEESGPMSGLLAAAQETAFKSVVAGVEMTKGVREMALSSPPALASIGGEDYLPVVMDAPSGEPIVIGVEPKDSGGRVGSMMSALKGRYGLTIHIEQDDLSGAAAARAAYQPYLSAMRLNALP
ncbi:hypothetical protein [Brevundimonas sp. ZS04]|uniref:hypothetical protein n=1 Tax=Brevundimonas sp. ZS04 TaxID=1906854 RepID=UPI00096D3313|nr:hypothetical protein [Brevundimonas sp. ZS04]OMG58330.1 hypothetical protein BJP32_09305 [Brevundimonas sp. ZS04]